MRVRTKPVARPAMPRSRKITAAAMSRISRTGPTSPTEVKRRRLSADGADAEGGEDGGGRVGGCGPTWASSMVETPLMRTSAQFCGGPRMRRRLAISSPGTKTWPLKLSEMPVGVVSPPGRSGIIAMGPNSEAKLSRNAEFSGVATTRLNGPAGPFLRTAAAIQIFPSISTRPAKCWPSGDCCLDDALAAIGEDAEVGPFAGVRLRLDWRRRGVGGWIRSWARRRGRLPFLLRRRGRRHRRRWC